MGLFTWSLKQQKYSKNISIKKGLRTKQAITKCDEKNTDKQVNRQQQHCKQLVYIYRDLANAKTSSFKGIHYTVLVCDVKGMTEKATAIQKEFSQSCVNTRYVWRE